MATSPVIELYSDGSFFHGRQPTFGWVAATASARVLAEGVGRCRNDRTNNVAAEIGGALAALGWAVAQGFKCVRLHCDLVSLPTHFRRSDARPGTFAAAATAWLAAHPEVVIEFRFERDSHRLVRRAHDLSRSVEAQSAPALDTSAQA